MDVPFIETFSLVENNLEEEEAAIIEEIAEVLQRGQKGKLPILIDIPKKTVRRNC